MNKTNTVPAVKRENLNVCAFLNAQVEKHNPRSAWKKGVKSYAGLLAYKLGEFASWEENAVAITAGNIEEILLNGAKDWKEFSCGGNAHIYDLDIAELLCSPSELKRCTRKDGSLRDKANSRETWLDVQARALFQAFRLLAGFLGNYGKKENA